MTRKHHLILYTFLGVAVITAALAAFTVALDARQSRQMLQDTYTRHMLEVQEHLQILSARLGKTAAAGDRRMQVELLSGVARQADGVVNGLTALPLSHAAMSRTIKFCNQLADYALVQALLCAGGQSLTDAERQRIGEMENQCTLLLGQLATHSMQEMNDPDSAMDYPGMIYDGALSDSSGTAEPKALGTGTIDAQQAVEIARDFVGAERVAKAEPGVETGGALPSYGVTLTLHDGTILNADVTRQGGKLLWIMPEHAAFASGLTLEECTQKAQTFLQSRGYDPMEAGHYQLYDGLAVISFAPVQDGVLLYPDLVKVQLRMDTGELVGLESSAYLMNHTRRGPFAPVVSLQEALERVSPQLDGAAARLCVIPYHGKEKLCWEVSGTHEEDEDRVYVDAQDGREIEVRRMIREPSGETAA